MFKVIIAGGRDFCVIPGTRLMRPIYHEDVKQAFSKIEGLLKDINQVEIVEGGALGADRIGKMYSLNILNQDPKTFPAGWDQFKKAAGYIRNKEMAEYADALIAFWDGKSKGTKHMIDLARKNNLKVKIFYY